jgi:O-antigen/teichoic acid export membrane protein
MSKSVNDTPKSASALASMSVARLMAHVRIPLFRNAYALMFSSMTTSALGLLYWLLAARYYSTEAVGINSAAIAGLMFLSGVAGLYLDGALVRFIPRAGPATGRFIVYAYAISAGMGALVSVVFLIGLGLWSPALAMFSANPWLSVGFILATATSCVFVLQDGALIGLRQAMWVPIENTIFSAVKIVLLIAFASIFPQLGLFASWTIPVVVSLVPVNILIFKRLIQAHQKPAEVADTPMLASQIVTYVAGNYIGYLFFLAYTRLLPLIVIQMLGSNASAYFFLPWIILTSLQLVTINMSQSLIVEASLDQTKLGIYARHALAHMARLLVPVVVVLVLGAPLILRVFGKSYAADGTAVLRLFALAVLPNMVCVLSLGLARIQRRIGRIILAQGVLAGLVLSLSYALIPRYGITGMGWAFLISQCVVAAILLLTQFRPILWPAHQNPAMHSAHPDRMPDA